MAKNLKVKVKAIGLLDLIAFTKLVPNRVKRFELSSDMPVNPLPYVNKLAKQLHPGMMKLVVKEIIKESDNVTSFVLGRADGQPAYFRAGQYLSIHAKVGDSIISRPYSISSAPKDALNGTYTVTIKKNSGGYFSEWVMENWKVGSDVFSFAPEGTFYYEGIRDASTVIGICGGSGVTPFRSMARAIVDGTENFNLILLYGVCKTCDILFDKEFKDLEKQSNGKFKVVHVLSEEKKKGYEQGFITADIIKKYAPADAPYSLFICGPQVMYNFVFKEIEKLNIPSKFVRRELFGEIKVIDKVKGYPKEAFGKVFKLTLNTYSGVKTVKARADESVLVAIERAGILAPSKCRSGVCGFCRSKLISGDVFIPEDTDGRRAADKKFGFIHPCSSYPISDLEVEILL
jgi:ferredoxin-NADP reductase